MRHAIFSTVAACLMMFVAGYSMGWATGHTSGYRQGTDEMAARCKAGIKDVEAHCIQQIDILGKDCITKLRGIEAP